MRSFINAIKSAGEFLSLNLPLIRSFRPGSVVQPMRPFIADAIKEPAIIAATIGATAGFAGNAYINSKSSKEQEIALAIQKKNAEFFEQLVDTQKEALQELKMQNRSGVSQKDFEEFRSEIKGLISAKKDTLSDRGSWISSTDVTTSGPVTTRPGEFLTEPTRPNNSVVSSMEADFKKAGLEGTESAHEPVFSPKTGDSVLPSPLDDYGIDVTSSPTLFQIVFYFVLFLQLFEAGRKVRIAYRTFGGTSQEFQKSRIVFEIVLSIIVLAVPVGVTLDALINRAFTSSMSVMESITLVTWFLVAFLALIYCLLKFIYSSPSSSDDTKSGRGQ